LGIRPFRCHEAIRVVIERSIASTAAEVLDVPALLLETDAGLGPAALPRILPDTVDDLL
jgi:hypothetical protein